MSLLQGSPEKIGTSLWEEICAESQPGDECVDPFKDLEVHAAAKLTEVEFEKPSDAEVIQGPVDVWSTM